MLEGKELPKLVASSWIGEEPEEEGFRGKVLVLQFVDPGLGLSMRELAKLQKLADEYKDQGPVAFAAVCDARADWSRMEAEAGRLELTLPVALDHAVVEEPEGPGEGADAGGDESAMGLDFESMPDLSGFSGNITPQQLQQIQQLAASAPQGQPIKIRMAPPGAVVKSAVVAEASSEESVAEPDQQPADAEGNAAPDAATPSDKPGQTAAACGVQFAPVTIVVDRSSKVRAVGLKSKTLKATIDKLLAEPYVVPVEEDETAEDQES